MIKVYVAHKFRASTHWQMYQSVSSAEAFGLRIAGLGALPVIPTAMFRNFHGTKTDQFWIDAVLELLKVSDVAFFCPDWETSTGCCGELDYCKANNIPYFFNLVELGRYLMGLKKRETRCVCTWEEGDSPCPVHGMEEPT